MNEGINWREKKKPEEREVGLSPSASASNVKKGGKGTPKEVKEKAANPSKEKLKVEKENTKDPNKGKNKKGKQPLKFSAEKEKESPKIAKKEEKTPSVPSPNTLEPQIPPGSLKAIRPVSPYSLSLKEYPFLLFGC